MANRKIINVEVRLDECNNDFERMMKKFSRNVKREGIVEELLDKRYYKKDSQIRNERNMFHKRRKKVMKIIGKLKKD